MLNFLLAIDWNAVIDAVNILWKGMLAIAVVIGIIIAVTLIINKSDVAIQKHQEKLLQRDLQELEEEDKKKTDE